MYQGSFHNGFGSSLEQTTEISFKTDRKNEF